jgi:Fe-S oxidoreductase
MALKDLENEMMRCPRCSECKWVPLAKIKSWRFAQVCPSIGRYNFHSYSGGGKLIMGLSVLQGRADYTDEYLDILHRCQMCGACDVSCKCNKDMEPLSITQELRAKAVEDGQLNPVHMMLLDGLKKEDNTMQAKKADRGKWADGLCVKDINREKTEVYFHAGCRYSFDEGMWPTVRTSVNLLKTAGLDVGIAGKEENCCGGRVYEMGYQGELTKYAEHTGEMLREAGIKTVVTSCSECYHAFKVLYGKIDKALKVEVLHITEYLHRLITQGRLTLTERVPMTVTYQDPCHLGRLGEPFIPWKGEEIKVFNHMYVYDPPKPWRKGTHGVYEVPRDLLRSIPGLNLVEMDRTREYAWCCGAGGGVIDAYPDFAAWTARERIAEAKTTGAEAMVTACPWCKTSFDNAMEEDGDGIKVLDIVELVARAAGKGV